jgi:hypothetical protein
MTTNLRGVTRALIRLLLAMAVLVVVAAAAFLIWLAGSFMPLLGWIAAILIAAALIAPSAYLWLAFRSPGLVPPVAGNSAAMSEYVLRFAERLRLSPLLRGRPLQNRQELEQALRVLDAEADRITETTARQVFISSAVSQHGSLDGLILLGLQLRMILRIARLYYVVPRVRELIALYRDLGGIGFFVTEHEEGELVEDAQPVLASLVASVVGAVPGLQAASTIVANALMTGSANAFLTLRLGVMTREYCRAVVQPDPRVLRRRAFDHALEELRDIVTHGSSAVIGKVWRETRHAMSTTVTGIRRAASSSHPDSR